MNDLAAPTTQNGPAPSAPSTSIAKIMQEPAPRFALQKAPLSLDQAMRVAEWIGKGGLIKDARDAYKVLTKIVLGSEFGLGIGASLMQLDIVEGKPVFEYPSLLAFIRQSGKYDYEIPELTDDAATVVIYRLETSDDGKIKLRKVGESRFTTEDAERARLTAKSGPTGKGDNVHTRYPKNMRLARAVSNAVKFHCSDVVYGIPVYAREEAQEFKTVEARVVDESAFGRHVAAPVTETTAETPPATSDDEPVVIMDDGATVNTETGEVVEINTGDERKRAAFAERQTRAQADLARLFRSAGIDAIRLRTDQSYAAELGRFFETREKRRLRG